MMGPTSVRFREATRDDVAAIVALLREDPLGARRETAESAAYLAAFDRMAAEPGNAIIVGDQGGIVACYQLTFISGLSREGMRRAQIEAVRVSSALRGQGVGEALMADAEARARASGCRMIQLTSDRSRERAHSFYERLGYVASHLGFKRML